MLFTASQMPPTLIRELATGFDPGRAQRDLVALCAPTFAGRRIGTAGHDHAHAWLAERMGELGFAVTTFEFTLEQPVLDLYAPPTLDADRYRREGSAIVRTPARVRRAPALGGVRRGHCRPGAPARVRTMTCAAPGSSWSRRHQVRSSCRWPSRWRARAPLACCCRRLSVRMAISSKRVMAASPAPLPVLVVRSDRCRPWPARRCGPACRSSVCSPLADTSSSISLAAIRRWPTRRCESARTYDGVGDDPGGDRIPGAADNALPGWRWAFELARPPLCRRLHRRAGRSSWPPLTAKRSTRWGRRPTPGR